MKSIREVIEEATRLKADIAELFRCEGDSRAAATLMAAFNDAEAAESALRWARMDMDRPHVREVRRAG